MKFISLVLLLFCWNSMADGILVEPYVGYHSARFHISDGPSPSARGLSYGGRLGVDFGARVHGKKGVVLMESRLRAGDRVKLEVTLVEESVGELVELRVALLRKAAHGEQEGENDRKGR